MKILALVFMALSLVLLLSEQAAADRMLYQFTREGRQLYFGYREYSSHNYLYPGEYSIHIALGNENLGCSLRVGTKSSNTNLLKLSGPLAVRNVTDPLRFFSRIFKKLGTPTRWRFPFSCKTTGTMTIAKPPTVSVPVMMTLTYGPVLTKTVPILVTQKIGIKSVSSSPARRTYSLNQRVTMTVNFTRKMFDRERRQLPTLKVKWRVREGKLCEVGYSSIEASNEWRELGTFDGQPKTRSATLCKSGRTLVEFGFVYAGKFDNEERAITDTRIKRRVFNVDKGAAPKRRSSRIRSRGIDSPPPLIIPDLEPPALPNFELQGDKP